MKFTAQEEYGLRCLLLIARAPEGALTIPEIAEREGLTGAHVAKMMRALREADLVTSTRGQKGGYQLARPPEQINIGLVLSALGGRLYSKDFCGRYTGIESTCVHNVDCSIRSLWMALDTVVQRALSQMTLKDMLCGEHEMVARVQSQLDNTALGNAGAGMPSGSPVRSMPGSSVNLAAPAKRLLETVS